MNGVEITGQQSSQGLVRRFRVLRARRYGRRMKPQNQFLGRYILVTETPVMSEQTDKQRLFRLVPMAHHACAAGWRLSYLPPTTLWVHAESENEARRSVAITMAPEGIDRDTVLSSSPWISVTLVECLEDKPSRTPSNGFVQLAGGTEVAIPRWQKRQPDMEAK